MRTLFPYTTLFRSPKFGADTKEILTEAGYREGEITRLIETGIVKSPTN